MTAVLLGILGVVLMAVLYSILGDELRAWIPYFARGLVRSAASRLPTEDRRRYERDWFAELAAWEDRPLSALAKALHIRLRVRSIRESVLGVSLRGEGLSRAMDIAFAASFLLLLGPLLAIITLAIRLDSKGPAFLGTARWGRDGQRFRLFKFRTMHVPEHFSDRELEELYRLAVHGLIPPHDDPRLTRVGHFLRRWSLDQLPQFVNVLRGEMSLVGPMPDFYTPNHKKGVAEIDIRNSVRPGIISPGLPEFSSAADGSDGPMDPFADRVQKEVEYVRSRSFLGDVHLLLRTVLIVFQDIRPWRNKG